MVRRCRAGLEEVTALDTLARAFHRAAQGKRARPEVQAFARNLLPNLARLGADLREGRAPLHVFRRFQIRDPKPRVIHAPVFEDRVAHHALMAVIGPSLDRALIDDAFACRVGKGSLAAVERAQSFVRRHPWYAKIDIAQDFASIPHDRLLGALHKKVSDRGVQDLVTRIVEGYATRPGYGLPIGSLTSQHFANLYLGGLDRHLLADPKVRGLVRYMDDSAWWCRSADDARATLASATAFVGDVLGLQLKGSGFVQRSHAGLSFLGFRIYPGVLKLSRRRKARYRAARARDEALYRLGVLDALQLQAGYASTFAITAHADAAGFRRADLLRCPPPDA